MQIFNLVIGKCLGTFGTIEVWEFFLNINFMKFKRRLSSFDGNFAFELDAF